LLMGPCYLVVSAEKGFQVSVGISCAFAPSAATPEYIAIAEKLGFQRAWCYDSPALYSDVWMILALAAQRTATIGLGPAVLIPSVRHPMVNASAIATLAELAPGRVAVAIGAGFSGRYTLGKRAMRWADVDEYVRVVRSLLLSVRKLAGMVPSSR
jgi:5,10-methylenetetrahydromethanopterin reductase